jgi:hypothetical protein
MTPLNTISMLRENWVTQVSRSHKHNTKTDNKLFARLEQFKYLGTILTNQNSIQEEE